MATIVQAVVDHFAKSHGMVKKSGAWFLVRDETILVLNLQKSNYASRYYLNVAVWLLPLGPADFPKEQTCHIRTRLGEIVPDPQRAEELLDADWVTVHDGAAEELVLLLEDSLDGVISATSSIDSLRASEGQFLVSRALVTGPAQRILTDGDL